MADAGMQAGEFFPAGLLHDIGVLPLAADLGQKYTRMIEQCSRKKERLEVFEQKRFGVDHAQVGGALTEHWRIAKPICESAQHHNLPERAPTPCRTFVRVIHAASALADRFGYPVLTCDYSPTIEEGSWCKLALSESDIPQIQADFLLARDESRLFGLLATQ